MAKKIPFKVVFASGKGSWNIQQLFGSFPKSLICLLLDEDSDYPASELNSHSPTVHGWRSNPSSPVTPKEIVLRFFNPARIVRIQVLAHQYFIRECSLESELENGFLWEVFWQMNVFISGVCADRMVHWWTLVSEFFGFCFGLGMDM